MERGTLATGPMPSVAVASRPAREAVVSELATAVAPVDASTSVDRFSETPFGEAIAVVEGRRVVGLVTRSLLAEKLFSRFGHALYGSRPIATLAMRDAIRLEASTSLEVAMAAALSRPLQHAYDDLIVVDHEGHYLGLLSVKKLILHQTRVLVAEREEKQLAERRADELAEHAALTTRFLATITHELRAPVNTLLGLAELVHAQLARGHVDKAGGHVGTMRKTAAQLRSLVDDVLDQAKLDAKRVTLDLDEFDVVALADDIVAATRALVLGKDVEVVVRAERSPCPVRSDRLKVRQILTNFASNAAKHTDRGSIELRVSEGEGGSVVLSVADTGSGIPAAALGLLFEPFVQVDDPATRRHGGTGLGLANAKRFAELLGARIDVDSRVGRGSVFSLHLPNPSNEAVP